MCLRNAIVRMSVALLVWVGLVTGTCPAENWPRWRGRDGNAVSGESPLPVRWSTTENIRWKVRIPGEGASSPIVWGDRLFLTSAFDDGYRRAVHCLDRETGKILWTKDIEDDWPEITSALTGYAAPTPVTDGKHVVAFFGNAGVVCYDFQGKQLWRRDFGNFETELGIASSPMLYKDSGDQPRRSPGRVILVCDHDGTRFSSFDSFLIALDVATGKTVWKTDRPKIGRSWSTPIVVPVGKPPNNVVRSLRERNVNSRSGPPCGRCPTTMELIVNAQDELRGYDPKTGKQLWHVTGMTGWVTPSPVFGRGLIFAASGKDGPTMAVKPGGRGNVTASHLIWQTKRGAPYVCSPLLYGDQLYVHNEQGILTCYNSATGQILYQQRLQGKYMSSGVAGDGRIYLTNDRGTTFVIRAGDRFEQLAENALDEECLASPAISGRRLFLRTRFHLFCIGPADARTEGGSAEDSAKP